MKLSKKEIKEWADRWNKLGDCAYRKFAFAQFEEIAGSDQLELVKKEAERTV